MFKSLCSLAFFATTAFAQSVHIALPQTGTSVTPGETITVQIQRPGSLTASVEVAIIIGFQPCSNGGCLSPADDLPNILYNGPFNPQYNGATVQYENFTVQIPSSAPSGPALIGVDHVALVGASNQFLTEVLNQTITVA